MANNIEYIGNELLKYIEKSNEPFIVDGEVIGLPFNLSQLVDVYGKESIPDKLGIYHLFYNEQLGGCQHPLQLILHLVP